MFDNMNLNMKSNILSSYRTIASMSQKEIFNNATSNTFWTHCAPICTLYVLSTCLLSPFFWHWAFIEAYRQLSVRALVNKSYFIRILLRLTVCELALGCTAQIPASWWNLVWWKFQWYEQLLRPFFSCFQGQKKVEFLLKT